jgi:hypothetical protein
LDFGWRDRRGDRAGRSADIRRIITQTIRKSQKPIEPYEKFIFAALAWMIAAFSLDWRIFAADIEHPQSGGDSLTNIRPDREWRGSVHKRSIVGRRMCLEFRQTPDRGWRQV